MKSFFFMGAAILQFIVFTAVTSMVYAIPAMLGIWLWQQLFNF